MKKTLLLPVMGALFATSAWSHAALVVGWDFDPLTGGVNNFGPATLAATTTDPNATSSGLVRGSGIGTTGTGGANGWGGNDFTIASPSFAVALAANEFATFSITTAAGYELSLSDFGAYNIRRSASGPSTGQWQYQIGAGTFQDIGTTITWGAITTGAGNPQASINLAGISELQDIAPETTITFRLVTWGATTTGGTFYLNDGSGTPGIDFSLNGTFTAVVPEQTAALLGAFGLLGLLRRRR